jgi:hypothetical protein
VALNDPEEQNRNGRKIVVAPLRPDNVATAMGRDEVLHFSLASEGIGIGKQVNPQGATPRSAALSSIGQSKGKSLCNEERANVVRRPVSGTSVKDIDRTDKVIEVMEAAEEAVISKSAHVAGEVLTWKGRKKSS